MNENDKILDAFTSIIPSGNRKSSKGWNNFNCPSCGDTKNRGGFLITPTGGFRYRCFNAGCDFNSHTTGWEPDSGIGGRPRQLFQLLGGDPKNLPLKALIKRSDSYTKKGELKEKASDEKPVYYFKTELLPEGSVEIFSDHKYKNNRQFLLVQDYLTERGEELACSYPFMWSPKLPTHLIIPYYHHNNAVGYLARNIDKKSEKRFFGTCPSDYTFKQDMLDTENLARSVIVTEGVMDAIAVNGVACRNSVITKKQELLLQLCGRRIIILPDMEKDGIEYVKLAERNGWDVSIPRWDMSVKDAVEASKRYGRLYTIESVISGATKNYLKARTKLAMIGKSK